MLELASWHKEPEFFNFSPCLKHVYNRALHTNRQLALQDCKINLVIVDACNSVLYQKQQNKNLLVTNNWVAPDQIDSKYYEQFPPSWYGIYAGSSSDWSGVIEKKFNCFINRMDPIRQSWLYQLVRRDVFNLGFVSFNMDISRHVIQNQCANDATPADVFEMQFQSYLKIFQVEHDLIKLQVPYRNFDNNCNLNQIIMNSEFSIVLETYFDCNEIITFSEKIFRCLKLPRPWIMFAMKGAVKHLRDIGFDVLDDLVDHHYDNINFAIERQVALLDQVEIMCNHRLTQQEIKRCMVAAHHNQLLLNKMFGSFYQDINSTFDRASHKVLQLI
jgi:hypothetical protein